MAPRGGGRQVGKCPPKGCAFCAPKTTFFGPERPRNPVKMAKPTQTFPTPHVRLNCRSTKSLIALELHNVSEKNGPKWRQKAQKCAQCAPTPRKPSTGRILGYVAQNPIPRAPSPPATPRFFMVSKPQNRPTRRRDPRTSGHLVEPEGSPVCARWGPTVGLPGSPGAKEKIFFSKVVPRPLEILKQVFLARGDAFWPHAKSQNALKRGRFGTKNG